MTIMTEKKKIILEAVEKLTDTYRKEELFLGKDRERLPNKKEIINFIKDMRSIIFPGYFSVDSSASVFPEHYVAYRLNDLYDCLQEQIEIAFLYQGEEEQKAKGHAEQITERFFANVPDFEKIIVLCPKQWVEHTKNLIEKHIAPASDKIAVIEGGDTRNETIMNAIKFIEAEGNLNDDTIIVTHDSVRPFVTGRIIKENIEFAKQYGACDTVVPATDTIVEANDNTVISSIPDRSKMYQGQTPQSFNALKLKNIYNSLSDEEKDILTDAAKIFVIKGENVALVEGETFNMKITYPYDLKVAKSLLEDESDD